MMRLIKYVFALLLAGLSPLASATALGEGQILSRVGEAFAANIDLLGGYNRDVKFSQVRSAECRSSVIAKSANGCDSVYEGQLTFVVKRRSDGQYFIRVEGERGNELYYRIIVKTVSAYSGTVYNAFEFLPEMKSAHEVAPPEVSDGEIVSDGVGRKYGLVLGKVLEVPQDEASGQDVQSAVDKKVEKVVHTKLTGRLSDETGKAGKKDASTRERVSHPSAPDRSAESQLQIKKYGEYADDIYVLHKDSEEIEHQISLLEKQIGLLKEVARLKNQVGASSVPATALAAHAAQPAIHESSPGILTWVLSALVVLLLAALVIVSRRQKSSQSGGELFSYSPTIRNSPLESKESLDLTGIFSKRGRN